MRPLRAVIFDLDGTLIDSLRDLADSMNAALSTEGFPPHEADRYKRFVGDGVVNLVRRAAPESSRDPQTLARLVQAMRREYAMRYLDSTRLYDGIGELLDTLSAAGVALAVLSNKPHDMTCRLVHELLAAWNFSEVLGAAPERPRKPDPSAALSIANAIKVSPAQVLYLGDTDTDMVTAVAAGMYAVGALWGFRDGPELLAAGADRLAEHPSEVAAMLTSS